MDNKIKKHIEKLVREEISIVPYNPKWPRLFEEEADFLRRKLPQNLVKRIEHFGSTAIPELSAKPIIDILVEVNSLDETKKHIVPILEAEGYEHVWRPAIGDQPPFYPWFIKRNCAGQRTHHIHMVEADSELWDRLYFRDYLRQFPAEAKRYDELKRSLSEKHPNDRVKYTEEKSGFILSVTEEAKEYYQSQNWNII
jgi:GrpB-like predicted nucleotidyltransferase (UPF0157 family)